MNFTLHINVRQPFNKNEWMSDTLWSNMSVLSGCCLLVFRVISIRYHCDFVSWTVLSWSINFSTETKWNFLKKNSELLNGTKPEDLRVCSTWHYCAVKRISCDILLGVGWKPEKPYCSVFCVLYRTLHAAAMPKMAEIKKNTSHQNFEIFSIHNRKSMNNLNVMAECVQQWQ